MKTKYEYDCNKVARRKFNKRYYARTQYAVNHYKRWTEEELRLVLAHEVSDTDLAKLLNRSVGAIQRIRWRFKKKKYAN